MPDAAGGQGGSELESGCSAGAASLPAQPLQAASQETWLTVGQGAVHVLHSLTWFLQEENEEMGRELGEGKVHGLERQLALAKSFAEDMRRAHAELEDHCTTLDEEAEKLQDEVGGGMEAEAAVGHMGFIVIHAWAVLNLEAESL